MKNLKQFVDSILENDGATFNINTGVSPTAGFVVADGRNEIIIRGLLGRDSEHVTLREQVKDFVLDNAENLYGEKSFIGGWVDGGAIVLDVVEVIEDKKEAVIAGLNRNQKAIYDLNEGKDINLPSKRQSAGTETQKETYIKLLVREVLDRVDALEELRDIVDSEKA